MSTTDVMSCSDMTQHWKWPVENGELTVFSTKNGVIGSFKVSGWFGYYAIPLTGKDLTKEHLGSPEKVRTFFSQNIPRAKWSFLSTRPVIYFVLDQSYQVSVELNTTTKTGSRVVTVDVTHFDTVHKIKHLLLDRGHYVHTICFMGKSLEDKSLIGDTDIPRNPVVKGLYWNRKLYRSETCGKCHPTYRKRGLV